QGDARWSSRVDRAGGPRHGGLGSRRGAGPHSRGRRASPILRVARHSACANGRRLRSRRAGWCRGSRSHSAAGPSSISPSRGSPRHGQQRCCSATVAAVILCRHRPFAFPATLGIAAMAAGFATATVKREIIAHPVLTAPVWNVELAGFVELREERERSERIVVRLERTDGARLNEPLERVGVSVRKGTAPAVGSFVEFKARLSPPLEPLRPGGYDFARDMYFQRIGASGFVLGRIRTAEAPHAPTPWLRYATFIDGMREAIDKRIRAVLPGDKGSIASALITGKRDAISQPVFDAMYVSGIGHVLSISGYHMAVVVAIVFFVIRASLALLPGVIVIRSRNGRRWWRSRRPRSICCCRAPRWRPSARISWSRSCSSA